MSQQLVSRSDACAELNISLSTFDRLVRAGRLPVVRISRKVYVRRDQLDTFVATLSDEGESVIAAAAAV